MQWLHFIFFILVYEFCRSFLNSPQKYFFPNLNLPCIKQICFQTAMKSKDKLFDELISSIQKQRTLIKQLIEAQEKLAVVRAEALQLQLEEEIARLKKRDADLEQLSHTEDHIHFIQVGNVCILCCRPTHVSF